MISDYGKALLTNNVSDSSEDLNCAVGDESPATSDEDGELMSRLVEELPLGKSGDDYVSRDYPPLLRAQRLSYAMAVIMPNARQVGIHSHVASHTLILQHPYSVILHLFLSNTHSFTLFCLSSQPLVAIGRKARTTPIWFVVCRRFWRLRV